MGKRFYGTIVVVGALLGLGLLGVFPLAGHSASHGTALCADGFFRRLMT